MSEQVLNPRGDGGRLSAAAVGLYGLAALSLGGILAYYVRHPDGYDLSVIVAGISRFLHHQQVYTAAGYGRYLYPPSSFILLWPLGVLGFARAHIVYMLLEAASIVAAVAMSLRMFRVTLLSPLAGAAFAAAVLSAPVIDELRWSNVDGLILSVFVGSMLAMTRRRWMIAGGLLGLTIAIKPTVIPIVLVLLLWRRWRAAALALALPFVLLVAGTVIAGSEGLRFFTVTAPLIMNGLGHDLAGGNIALAAVFQSVGVSPLVGLAVRAALLLLIAVSVWQVRRTDAPLAVQVTMLVALILLGTYLLSSYSFLRYTLYLIPVLVMLAALRNPLPLGLGLVGLALLMLPYSRGLDERFLVVQLADQYRFTIGLLMLLAALVVMAWRPRTLPQVRRQYAAAPS